MSLISKYTETGLTRLLYDRFFKNKEGVITFFILAALLLIVLPLFLGTFRLNLVGKYLCYAYVAIGLVMCWGHAES